MGLQSAFVSVKKRIALSEMSEEEEEEEEEPKNKGRLYRILRAFLVISMVALAIEVVAHFKKWNLNPIHSWEIQGLVEWSYMGWISLRVDYVAPLVMMLSKFCIGLFMIQSMDRLVQCIGCFWIKIKKLKPVIEGEANGVDAECSSFPMVLVQIPMCNEREVIK
ncbi:hypothetical protein U1Q18_038406 [Sarracenia purpurea var. burkii]